MIIIKNRIFLERVFIACAMFPFLFVRSDKKFDDQDLNHEKIHFKQQKELLILLFYVLY